MKLLRVLKGGIARLTLFFCFLMLLVSVELCAESQNVDSQSIDSQDVISFGALHVFTGEFAHLANRCRNGMEMAQSDVNRNGGIRGKRLRIIYEDWGPLDTKRSVSAAHKLISTDHISAIFPAFAEDTQAVAPIVERAKIPLMATSTGGVAIGQYGAHVFRATNGDGAMLDVFIEHLRMHNVRQACMVRANTAFFENIAAALVPLAEHSGITLKSFESSIELSDSKAIAARVKREPCEQIIALTSNTTFVPFVRDLRRQECHKPVLGPVYVDLDEVRKESASIIGELYLVRYRQPEGEFALRYQERYGEPPYRPAGNCYDAVRVMSTVMNDVGTEWSAVNSALHNLKGYKGVTGDFEVAKNNDRRGEIAELFKVTAVNKEGATITP